MTMRVRRKGYSVRDVPQRFPTGRDGPVLQSRSSDCDVLGHLPPRGGVPIQTRAGYAPGETTATFTDKNSSRLGSLSDCRPI